MTRRSVHRPALAAGLIAAVAALVACVPTPRPDPRTEPTTTTTTSTQPASTCQGALAAFLASANAGTYTSDALTVRFAAVAPLDNPATPPATGTPDTRTVAFTASGPNGEPLTPSPTQPVTISIYNAAALSGFSPAPVSAPGAEPVVMQVTSGSSVSFSYDGSFLAGPVTVQGSTPTGSTNPCTGTPSVALGATTVALARVPATTGTTSASLPVACPDGTPPADCPSAVLASAGGLQVSAVAGYAEGPPSGATPPPAVAHPPGRVARFTVDTGSIGAVVPGAELGPNVIGPGAPAFKSYEPSGDQYAGYLYLAPLTFMTASGTSTTIPVRVMATYSSGCAPSSTRCTTPPDPSVIHYLGVGFDRATPTPATQMVSPTDNALVQLAGAPGTVSPGYVLSASGVTTGLTPGVVVGFDTVDLAPDPVTPGDFDTAPGSISMTPPGGSTVTAPATVLMDTGIGGMFVNSPHGTFPHPLPADSTVQVTVGTTSPPLAYDFNSGPLPDGQAPVQAGGAPSTMDLIHQAGVAGVFVNTGRHVLYLADFLFDAGGRVGYSPLVPPLR